MKLDKINKVNRLCIETALLIEKILVSDQISNIESGFGNKTSGELKRKSMDLTRALAEMRKA